MNNIENELEILYNTLEELEYVIQIQCDEIEKLKNEIEKLKTQK